MNVGRRAFLQSFAAALAAAPFLSAEQVLAVTKDVEAGMVTPLVEKLRFPFKVTFPDGAVFEFDGFISSFVRTATIDGLVEDSVEIRPSGAMNISRVKPKTGKHVELTINGGKSLELKDIEMPTAKVVDFTTPYDEDKDGFVLGRIRRSNITMTGYFFDDGPAELLDMMMQQGKDG